MGTATFFLSTGRCGTQWVTEALRGVLGDRAEVEHEPLHNDYVPRRMLGASEPAPIGGRAARRMAEHADRIERTLATRDYVEAGHPCWGALPWLMLRFRGRMRVVHLVRHPVPTAVSWLSHGAFAPPLLPHLPAKELIAPTDAGVSFPEYAAQWAALTAYEKCLYFWAEVNALGLRLERDGGVSWQRLRYEDVFSSDKAALGRLGEFLGRDAVELRAVDAARQVDEHRFALASAPDLALIARHPRILAVADSLGYDGMKFDAAAIAARFRPQVTTDGRG
jgi:hypothetical protein